jgi:flagellar FliJ protein
MKRFRFRLASVRSLRELAEGRARENFGRAQKTVADATDHLRAAEQTRIQLTASLSGARATVFRPVEQIAGFGALRQAGQAEAEAARRLAAAQQSLAQARELWLASRRDLQVMQRLEERARLAHRTEADRAEQSLLDELAALATARPSFFP